MSSYNTGGYGYFHPGQLPGGRGGQDPGNYAMYPQQQPQHGVQGGGAPGMPAYGDYAEFSVPTHVIQQSGQIVVNKPRYNTRASQVVSINSKHRDTTKYPNANDYYLDLPATCEGVQSVELLHAQVPNTYYNIRENENDVLSITFTNGTDETDDIKIPEGFYTLGDLCAVIQELLNGNQTTNTQAIAANDENHQKTYARQLESVPYPSSTHSVSTNYAKYLDDIEASDANHIANFRVGFTWPFDDKGILANAGVVDALKKVYIANVAPQTDDYTAAANAFDQSATTQDKLAFTIDVANSTVLTVLGFDVAKMTAGTADSTSQSVTYPVADDGTDTSGTFDNTAAGHYVLATNLPDTSGIHHLNLCIDNLGLYKFATASGSSNLEVFAKVPLTSEFGSFTFYRPEQLSNIKRFPELLPSLRSLHVRWTDTDGNLVNFHGVDHDFSIEIACDKVR